MSRIVLWLTVSCCLAASGEFSIVSADPCDATLVVATVNASQSSHTDWRVSYLITESNYDEVKKDLGLKAVIKGVPLGGNWDDFHANQQTRSSQYGESLTADQARSIALTGLDKNSVDAYKACLQAKVFLSNGIHAAIVLENENDVAIYVVYKVPKGPLVANIVWDPPQLAKSTRKPITSTEVADAGAKTIVILRPKTITSLVGNFGGAYTTEAITIFPKELPVPPTGKIEASRALFYGLDANCNAGEVTIALGQKGCSNLPIGYSAKQGDVQLYWGITDNVNRGMVTIRPNFMGGSTEPSGFTLKEKPDPKATELFVVLAGKFPNCDRNAGQVTVSAGQLGCDTRSIGWILP